MVRLQQEIFNLRAEKAALEEGKRLGFVGEPVRDSTTWSPWSATR